MIDTALLASSVARIPNPPQLRLHIPVFPSSLLRTSWYSSPLLACVKSEVTSPFLKIWSCVPLLAFGRTSPCVGSRMVPVPFQSRTSVFRRPSHLSMLSRFPQPTHLIFLFLRTCTVMLRKSGSSSYSQVTRSSPTRFIHRVLVLPADLPYADTSAYDLRKFLILEGAHHWNLKEKMFYL